MKTNTFHPIRTSLLVFGMILAVIASAFPSTAFAAPPPAPTCTEASGVRTCDLYAKAGTLSLPGGGSVTIWGYALDNASPAGLPGPTLIANSGETLQIVLHNNLGEATSLSIPSLGGASDLTGAGAGGTKTYTFPNLQAGTYLYQAGPTANGERQVGMGMHGVLIVRPAGAPQQAYGPASAFDVEAVLVMSEIDTALNASPTGFDMREFNPKYFLFNGKAYPNTAEVDAVAGNKVLLRVVNAGIQSHPIAVLGLNYTVLSIDGKPLAYPYSAVSETLGAGQTADMLVTIPASATPNQRFAVYNPNMRLLNNNQRFGGMLTFLHVLGSTGIGDTTGPIASGLSLTPNPSNGSSLVTLNATIDESSTGGSVVSQAEYFIDTPGANGSGVGMNALVPPFDSVTEAVTATIDPGPISSGSHTVYVHGKDVLGNWGAFKSIALILDKTGPSVTGLSANPNPSNGTASVALSGTANDSASGNNNVVDAEFFIDVAGANGSGTHMTRNQTAPIVALTGTISASTMSGLSEGYHWVHVHALDSKGNWGEFTQLQIGVDKTGPATDNVQLRPNPNNGAQAYAPTIQSVRVDARFTEPGTGPVTSTVKNAEFFIDTVGANGTGILMTPSDGLFNSSTENAYAYIPLSTVNALAQGNHVVSIHGRDAGGNWGPFFTVNLVIDKTNPTVSGLTAISNPTNTTSTSNTSFVLTGTAADPLAGGVNSNIVRAEWFEGTDPGLGFGTAMQAQDGAFDSPTETITAAFNFVALGWTRGNHTLTVRAKDAAGNWSPTVSVTVNVVYPNNIFSNGFETGNFSAWSTTGGNTARISVTSGSAQSGTYKMQAQILSGTSGYVQDNSPFTDTTYHARFYFNPNNYNTGNGGNPAGIVVFRGLDAANATAFQVEYRGSASVRQVRLVVSRSGGTTATNWFAINNNAWNAIEISWASGNSASAALYTGGTLRQSLTGLNTSAFILDTVRLGPQPTGATLPNSGTVYFDNFASTRNTLIGP
jgi:FtsP/CotA-like multicopper oxidase with cupredoxin domain